MRRRRLLVALLTAVLPPAAALAQERPLRTADPVPVRHGWISLEGGVDVLMDVDFPLSGLSGDLVRAPAVSLRLGLGGTAEFQVMGGHNFLFIEERREAPFSGQLEVEGDLAHDIEDPVIATKVRLHRETRRGPATALRVVTRLPSAGNASGLGNDTMDFLLWILAGKSVGRTRVLANVGLGVLGDPRRGDRQNDVLLYGLAASRPLGDAWELAGEIHGRVDTKAGTPVGTENSGQARLGARWTRRAITLDAALIAGLHRTDPDLGLTFGLSWLRRARL